VGLPDEIRSMDDVRMLWLSLIYLKTTWGNFFNELDSHEGMKPYITRDKGYPLRSS
jgi:hypothetical protein